MAALAELARCDGIEKAWAGGAGPGKVVESKSTRRIGFITHPLLSQGPISDNIKREKRGNHFFFADETKQQKSKARATKVLIQDSLTMKNCACQNFHTFLTILKLATPTKIGF